MSISKKGESLKEDADLDDYLMFKCNSLKNEYVKCLDEYENKIFFKSKKMKTCENKEKEFINCHLHTNMGMGINKEQMSLKTIKNEEYKKKSNEIKELLMNKKSIDPSEINNSDSTNNIDLKTARIINDSMNKNVKLKEFKI